MDQVNDNRTDAQLQAMLRAEILELRTELSRRDAEISALLHVSDAEAINQAVEQELSGTLARRLWTRLRRMRHRLSYRKYASVLSESMLFDSDWYVKQYPECDKPEDAIFHYLRKGAYTGHHPGPEFDTDFYYQANPDVAADGWPALVHYVIHGRAEGRRSSPVIGD